MGNIVATVQGKVEGIEKAGVVQFRGVPFAAPPVGANRFRPPQPHEGWDGVRLCDTWGPYAPQVPSPAGLLPAPEHITESEDCLFLNVFTPSCDDARRPVMVWVHGGAFLTGSGRDAWYNGTSFARNGAVVVTINYRLGPLGFLAVDGFPGSGNCGLLDQVAALEWVRDNIAAFGGDPTNVTIFGESAGGMAVATLLGLPAAAGLYQRAIPQSGAASMVKTLDDARQITARLADVAGIAADDLAAADPALLCQAVATMRAEAGGILPLSPVVDGDVLPRPPLEAIAAGSAAGVPVVTGTTRDEMTLFLMANPAFSSLDDERLGRLCGPDLAAAYRSLHPEASAGDLAVMIETDRMFRVPAIRLAEAQIAHAPVWMYMFTWESPVPGLKACHALEIPFVWNSLGVRGTEMFAGGGPEAEALAAEMHQAWFDFATTGEPGWSRYDSDRRATRVYGPGGGITDDPLGPAREMWAGRG